MTVRFGWLFGFTELKSITNKNMFDYVYLESISFFNPIKPTNKVRFGRIFD